MQINIRRRQARVCIKGSQERKPACAVQKGLRTSCRRAELYMELAHSSHFEAGTYLTRSERRSSACLWVGAPAEKEKERVVRIHYIHSFH